MDTYAMGFPNCVVWLCVQLFISFGQQTEVRGMACDRGVTYWLWTEAEITLASLASGCSGPVTGTS